MTAALSARSLMRLDAPIGIRQPAEALFGRTLDTNSDDEGIAAVNCGHGFLQITGVSML